MKPTKYPTQKELKELFEYTKETGDLTLKVSTKYRDAGTVCKTPDNVGYYLVHINGRTLKQHRVIWIWYYGSIPEGMIIDHINGIKNDNRISNLRLNTCRGNAKNKVIHKTNKSGYTGVIFDKKHGYYRSYISSDTKRLFLGLYATYDEAVAARKAGEICLGYTTRPK